MLGHTCHLPLDIDEDVCVHNHHDQEDDQVGDGPEGQVAPAVERCHAGALLQSAETVPAIGRDEPQEQSRDPDTEDEDHHTLVGHFAV